MISYNIYKLGSTQGPEFYIGSTTETLEKRFDKHLSTFWSVTTKKTRANILFETYDIDTIYILSLHDG